MPSFNTNYGRSRPVVRVFESEISKSYHVRGHRLVLKHLYRSQTKESIVYMNKKDLLKMFAEKQDCVMVFKAEILEYVN